MGLKAPDFAPADNPASDASCLLTRALMFLYLPAFNFYLLLFPRWLSFDWSMESIPLIHSVFDVRNLATLVFYACLFLLIKFIWHQSQNTTNSHYSESSLSRSSLCLACGVGQPIKQSHHNSSGHTNHHKPRSANNNNGYHHSHVCKCKEEMVQLHCGTFTSTVCDADETSSTSSSTLSYTSSSYSSTTSARSAITQTRTRCLEQLAIATALLVLPFIPATNLFFYVGFVVAERILYIPSMGYCLFIAIGMEALMKRKTSKFITLIALSILLMSFAARTFVRNIDWQSEEKLYASGIPINPPKGNYPFRLCLLFTSYAITNNNVRSCVTARFLCCASHRER